MRPPAAGRCRARRARAPLHSVQVARQLPEPKIKARVGGRGAKRILSYSLKPQPGLTVSFVEGVDGGASPLGTGTRIARHDPLRAVAGLEPVHARSSLSSSAAGGSP